MNPTYLICSRDSAQCQEALEALKNTVDIHPQLEILWMEDNPKSTHHPTLMTIVESKRKQTEVKKIIVPSVAFFHHDTNQYIHHEGSQYLMFIHNFIRDKKHIHMQQHKKKVDAHPSQIKSAHSNLQKMFDHTEQHQNSKPIGHAKQQVQEHHDHTQTYKNNDFITNLRNMAHFQANKLFEKLNKK